MRKIVQLQQWIYFQLKYLHVNIENERKWANYVYLYWIINKTFIKQICILEGNKKIKSYTWHVGYETLFSTMAWMNIVLMKMQTIIAESSVSIVFPNVFIPFLPTSVISLYPFKSCNLSEKWIDHLNWRLFHWKFYRTKDCLK